MIYVTGDCHGDYSRFEMESFPEQEEMDRYDYVIVAGDFGFWSDSVYEKQRLDWLEGRNFTTLWVDGNHENYDLLKKIPVVDWNGGKVQFIRPHVIHLMRGQMYTLQGRKIFTFGGARSTDIVDGILEPEQEDFQERYHELTKQNALFRVKHESWWEEELPSEQEMEVGRRTLDKHGKQCDYIITHCAPTSMQAYYSAGRFQTDELTDYLEEIYKTCQYQKWICGHYHDEEMLMDGFEIIYRKIMRIC